MTYLYTVAWIMIATVGTAGFVVGATSDVRAERLDAGRNIGLAAIALAILISGWR